MGNPVVHFEVAGRGPQRLQTFYRKAFEWTMGEPISALNGCALAKPNATYGIDEGIEIFALGGRTLMPPEAIPGGRRFALFADPEGHAVGLIKTASDAQAAG